MIDNGTTTTCLPDNGYPEEWKTATLGELVYVKGGKRLPKGHSFSDSITAFPYIRVVDFTDWLVKLDELKYLTTADREAIKRYIIKKEDIYISIAGTIGLVGVIPPELDGANLTENAARLIIGNSSTVHQKFLVAYLSSPIGRHEIEIRTSKTSQPKLALTRIKQIPVALPSLPEQKKIAYILSAVQESKEKTEAVIEATNQLKKSLMKYLFTYGPVSVKEAKRVKLKETESGMVPEEWEVKQLIEVATLQRGKDLPKHKRRDGRHPVVGSGGIIGYHNQYVCKGPGVVTGRSGSIGTITYVRDDYWPHNTGLYVKDFHGNESRFVFYLLHRLDFKKYATGVSVPTLNRNFVHTTLLPVPNLRAQLRISKILSIVDSKIETDKDKLQALDSLFQTLLNNLMNGKIRVNSLELGP